MKNDMLITLLLVVLCTMFCTYQWRRTTIIRERPGFFNVFTFKELLCIALSVFLFMKFYKK